MVLFVLGFLLQLCTATGSRPTQSLRANISSLFKQNPGSQTETLKLTGHIFKESIPLLSSRDDVFRHSRMSSDYQHDVVFVIKQKNMDELTTFLHDVSDPSSINYGRHMTRKAVAEMTANPEARAAVLTYLRQNGASVIAETLSSEYITSRAPVGVWERVFNCKFFLFHFSQADGEVTKVVRTESYSIPTALEHHVESVFNTVQMPHQPMNGFMTKVEGTESIDGKERLQSTDKYITPALLRTAYNIGTKQGSTLSSQCVYATGNQNFSPTDLVKFQSFFQLPSQPVATITGGHASSAVCDATPDLCGEANLDVQYLMAMSPVSPTTFWYSEYNGFSGWLVTIANLEKPPLVFSISYGIDEKLVPASEFTAFNTQAIKLGAIGVSIIAASGDDGAISRKVRQTPSACFYAPNFPASNPYVTAVGATSVRTISSFFNFQRFL